MTDSGKPTVGDTDGAPLTAAAIAIIGSDPASALSVLTTGSATAINFCSVPASSSVWRRSAANVAHATGDSGTSIGPPVANGLNPKADNTAVVTVLAGADGVGETALTSTTSADRTGVEIGTDRRVSDTPAAGGAVPPATAVGVLDTVVADGDRFADGAASGRTLTSDLRGVTDSRCDPREPLRTAAG